MARESIPDRYSTRAIASAAGTADGAAGRALAPGAAIVVAVATAGGLTLIAGEGRSIDSTRGRTWQVLPPDP